MRLPYIFFIALLFLTPFQLSGQGINLQEPIKYLAIGDDYTIATNERAENSWPNILIDQLMELNFAFAETQIFANDGWFTIDAHNELIEQEIEDEWNLVSINVGFNDHLSGGSMNLFSVQFTNLLDKAISLTGGDPKDVFVLSIPDYGFTPFGQHNIEYISENVALYNTVIQHFTDLRGAHYIDVTESSQLGLFNPEYLSSDGLHPSRLMYELWVDIILERMNTTTSIDIIESNFEVSVFPNPGYGSFQLTIPAIDQRDLTLNIFNGLGEKVKSEMMLSGVTNEFELDANPGIYFYQIISSSGFTSSGQLVNLKE